MQAVPCHILHIAPLMARDEQRTAAWQHWAREGHQDESSVGANGKGWVARGSVRGCLFADDLHPQDPVAQLTGRSNKGGAGFRPWLLERRSGRLAGLKCRFLAGN